VLRFYTDAAFVAVKKMRAQPRFAFFPWLVHLYTASGAVAGFAGIAAVVEADYRAAFLWMIAATAIDATDGMLARMARVKERTPRFDGARLDDIVDYLTFVVLPIFLLYHAGHLPEGWGVVVASMPLLSSAFGFVFEDAKTDDYFFTGFPSYWNIVALYIHAAALSPAVNTGILMTLSALVFVRTGYVYPSRTPVLQRLTLALCAVWGLMTVAVVVMLPDVPRVLLMVSLFFPAYYTVLSFVLHARRTSRPTLAQS
jgi:phosphatidylcholine synthase